MQIIFLDYIDHVEHDGTILIAIQWLLNNLNPINHI